MSSLSSQPLSPATDSSEDPLKILLCHNYYQQRGGEDQSFEQETAMLRQRGHEVYVYSRHNDDIKTMSRSE